MKQIETKSFYVVEINPSCILDWAMAEAHHTVKYCCTYGHEVKWCVAIIINFKCFIFLISLTTN